MTTDPKVVEMLFQEINDLKDALAIKEGALRGLGALCQHKDQLITELADALEEEFGESRDLMQSQQRPWNLIVRAREATK